MRLVLAVSVLIAALTLTSCGDDSEDTDADDPRRGEIGGVAELAVGAFASAGPEALADYMSDAALAQCPQDQLADALADQTVPTGFKQLRDVEFNDDSVTATITVSTREGEEDITWVYVDDGDGWRIDDMPGMENCT